MKRHWFSRPRWGNCLLFALALLLRGRVGKVYRYRGSHWVGLTRRGTVVHLRTLNHKKEIPFLTFYGKPHAFRKGR